ncbi:MAG: fluoride efflux transporter CrcB [Calditrichaeota bacterium]|nr:MAG: fluoride efflux transporter CrcB [Calditrichota bacterium]
MLRIFFVGLGGFLGAIGRYAFSGLFYKILGTSFPYGTLFVNVTGSFFLGFFMTLAEERFLVNPEVRSFFAIGFLGAFTTFSTFSYETMELFRESSSLAAVNNIVANLFMGLVAVFLGMNLAKLL